jgi:hypothetical protein
MSKTQTIITQAEFSRLCGVSKQALRSAIKRGKVETTIKGGRKQVVYNHQLTQLYQEEQANKKAVKKELSSSKDTEKNESTDDNVDNDDDESSLSSISLARQKTVEEIKKIKADTRFKEFKLEVERSRFIEKEKLGLVLFQYLNAVNINMLNLGDMLIDSLIDKVRSGMDRGELLKIFRSSVEDEIKRTKKQIKERLK